METPVVGVVERRQAPEPDGSRRTGALRLVRRLLLFAIVALTLAQGALAVHLYTRGETRPPEESARYAAAIVTVALSLAALVGVWIAVSVVHVRRRSGPLVRITRHVHELSAGHMGRRILVRSGDELEALANALNDLADQVQDRERSSPSGPESR